VFDNADDAIAKVEEDVRRAQQRAGWLPQLRAAIEAAWGRAVSRQRDLAVEVDHTGQVTSLRIHDVALERGGTRLASDLVGLVSQARHEVKKLVLAAASDVLGEDDPLLGSFRVTVDAGVEVNPGDRSGRLAGRM
jgi:hypothetical protein